MRQPRPTKVKAAWPWQYFLYCWILRTWWKFRGGTLHVMGLERMPMTGPCIVIANHQSYLDPLFLHAVVPRILHPMAKSTQFKGFMGFMLAHVYTFPVRRYQTDPQAARTVLRRLAAGNAVMIYIEGERTWDGRLQPFRRGVLKLIQRAGVPVIPVRIDGAYEVWPRWDRSIQAHPVTFQFMEPLAVRRDDSLAELAARLQHPSRLADSGLQVINAAQHKR